MKEKIKVIQIIDTLSTGGAERAAVNIINSLPSEKVEKYFCTTRKGGPLLEELNKDVVYLNLTRKTTFDLIETIKLYKFIKNNNIQIIHAHSSSLFISKIMKTLLSNVKVIWHDHYGMSENNQRSIFLYKIFTKRVDFIFSVNQKLSEWALINLKFDPNKINVLPNFIVESGKENIISLPGTKKQRIVCVSNMRTQKDHFSLIKAMKIITDNDSDVHLLLIGKRVNNQYTLNLLKEIKKLKLEKVIHFFDEIDNVQPFLKQCSIGVLSSKSEGLPIALLEYGLMGLAVVVTNVGQCAEVVDFGSAGLLVEPENPEALAQAIIFLLNNEKFRSDLALKLQNRVVSKYSEQAVIPEIIKIYQQVLSS